MSLSVTPGIVEPPYTKTIRIVAGKARGRSERGILDNSLFEATGLGGLGINRNTRDEST